MIKRDDVDQINIKLIDFGLCGIIGVDPIQKQKYGTMGYMGIDN